MHYQEGEKSESDGEKGEGRSPESRRLLRSMSCRRGEKKKRPYRPLEAGAERSYGGQPASLREGNRIRRGGGERAAVQCGSAVEAVSLPSDYEEKKRTGSSRNPNAKGGKEESSMARAAELVLLYSRGKGKKKRPVELGTLGDGGSSQKGPRGAVNSNSLL